MIYIRSKQIVITCVYINGCLIRQDIFSQGLERTLAAIRLFFY